MLRPVSAFAAVAVAVAVALPAPAMAQAPDRTKSGTLTCDVSGGVGMIIAAKKEVTCIFSPSAPGPREVYVGSITKFGLDVGATAGGEMVWHVVAPTTRKFGALAGRYAGASGEATVGAGVRANLLVGGADRAVTLQPVSLQGQAGVNLAVGVAGLELQPSR